MSFLRRILLFLAVQVLFIHSALPHSHAFSEACQSGCQPCAVAPALQDTWDAFLLFNPSPNHLEDFYPSDDYTLSETAINIGFLPLDLPPVFDWAIHRHSLSAHLFLLATYQANTAAQTNANGGFNALLRVLLTRARAQRAP